MSTKMTAPAPSIPLPSALGRFALSFMAMCFAMCAGGAVLNLVVFGAASLAGVDLVRTAPEISMLILGVDWAIAMGAWMAVRRHPWRHNLEMSSTAVIVGILFASASWLGVTHPVTGAGWLPLFLAQCGPSCLLMAADMVFRYSHYSGQADHSAHAH